MGINNKARSRESKILEVFELSVDYTASEIADMTDLSLSMVRDYLFRRKGGHVEIPPEIMEASLKARKERRYSFGRNRNKANPKNNSRSLLHMDWSSQAAKELSEELTCCLDNTEQHTTTREKKDPYKERLKEIDLFNRNSKKVAYEQYKF